MKRSLTLKREALAELTPTDLLGVNGGAADAQISLPHPVCTLIYPTGMSCGMTCGC